MDANLQISLGSVRIRHKEGFSTNGGGKNSISNLVKKQNATPQESIEIYIQNFHEK